jgi:hypothetical protein
MNPEGMALLLARLDAIDMKQTRTTAAVAKLQGMITRLVREVQALEDGESGGCSEDEVSDLLGAGDALNHQVKIVVEQSEPVQGGGSARLLTRADRLELERLSREWFAVAKEVKL